MGLNAELAGKVYPPITYAVTAEAIRRYAAATNEDNPRFTGESPVAPPCFPIVAAMPVIAGVMFDPELGANLPRLVHGEQEHVLLAPILPGDSLTVEGRLASVEAKESGETFTILTTLTGPGGVAAELRSLMFIRGGAGRGVRTQAAAPPRPAAAFEASMRVAEDQTVRYAEASGDHNPIHLDEEFARNAAGLPGVILHGMCTMAFAAKAVLDGSCGGEPERLRRVGVRFSRPVFPGQVLTTRGWVEGPGLYGFETVNERGDAVIRNGVAEVAG